jgi:hypothetical protein
MNLNKQQYRISAKIKSSEAQAKDETYFIRVEHIYSSFLLPL